MPFETVLIGNETVIGLAFFAGTFVVFALRELSAPWDWFSLASVCGLSRIVGAVADY